MKKVKNNTIFSFLIAAILILSSTMVQAQQGERPSRGQGPDQQMPPVPDSTQIAKMVTDISTELSLTEDQLPVVSSAFFNHFEEVKALTEKGKRPDRETMEEVKKSFETEVEAVLTKDQKKLFKAYMKKMQPKQGPPQR
jgi:hypothetical protein